MRVTEKVKFEKKPRNTGMEKEENEKMKALARYGKEFGGYRMIDVQKPICGWKILLLRSRRLQSAEQI